MGRTRRECSQGGTEGLPQEDSKACSVSILGWRKGDGKGSSSSSSSDKKKKKKKDKKEMKKLKKKALLDRASFMEHQEKKAKKKEKKIRKEMANQDLALFRFQFDAEGLSGALKPQKRCAATRKICFQVQPRPVVVRKSGSKLGRVRF